MDCCRFFIYSLASFPVNFLSAVVQIVFIFFCRLWTDTTTCPKCRVKPSSSLFSILPSQTSSPIFSRFHTLPRALTAPPWELQSEDFSRTHWPFETICIYRWKRTNDDMQKKLFFTILSRSSWKPVEFNIIRQMKKLFSNSTVLLFFLCPVFLDRKANPQSSKIKQSIIVGICGPITFKYSLHGPLQLSCTVVQNYFIACVYVCFNHTGLWKIASFELFEKTFILLIPSGTLGNQGVWPMQLQKKHILP